MAVVIGNSAYRAAETELPNAARDAQMIAERLTGIGFEVRTHYDLADTEMRSLPETLSAALADARIGVIYYAGHAVQIGGKGYLLPVDLEHLTADEIMERRIPIADLIEAVSASAEGGLRMFVIDACRDDPFSGLDQQIGVGLNTDEGFASASDAQVETLIAYSASSGQLASDGPPGGNGPYALALSAALAQPRLEVLDVKRRATSQVFDATDGRQIPWLSGTLRGEYWLNPSDLDALDVEEPGLDTVVWRFLQTSGDRNQLRRFPNFFPQSDRRPAAEARLAALSEVPAPDDAGPAAEVEIIAEPGAPIPADIFDLDRDALARIPGGIAATATECDWLAADFSDLQRVAPAVRRGLIDIERAALACAYAHLADLDEPRFAFQLGRVLEIDGRVPWARHFYRIAAQQGYAAALTNLGYLALNPPQGETPDPAAALRLYRQAASLGNLRARTNVGTLYRRGAEGVLEPDPEEAVAWYRLASEAGWVNAQNALADAYRRGQGVDRDPATAASLYQLAALNGQREAMHNYGRMLIAGWPGQPPREEDGVAWIERGIDAGSRFAPFTMARRMVASGAASADPERAETLFRLSWQRGHDIALIQLAGLLETGDGLRRDPEAAYGAARRAQLAGAEIDAAFVARLRSALDPQIVAAIDAEMAETVALNGR